MTRRLESHCNGVMSNIDAYITTIGNQSTKITLTCDKTLYWFIGPFWFSL